VTTPWLHSAPVPEPPSHQLVLVVPVGFATAEDARRRGARATPEALTGSLRPLPFVLRSRLDAIAERVAAATDGTPRTDADPDGEELAVAAEELLRRIGTDAAHMAAPWWGHPDLTVALPWWQDRLAATGLDCSIVLVVASLGEDPRHRDPMADPTAEIPPGQDAAAEDQGARACRWLGRWEVDLRTALTALQGRACTVVTVPGTASTTATTTGEEDEPARRGTSAEPSAAQRHLADLVRDLAGGHQALPAVTLPPATPWVTALADAERRVVAARVEARQAWGSAAARAEDAGTLWQALWALGAELAEMVEASLPPPVPPWPGDATTDLHGYLRWIAERESPPGAPGSATEHHPALADGPTISVVVPVYRPDLALLRSAIDSVRRQTYDRWELCLCDDGSGDPVVTAALQAAAASDPRIRVTALAANGGISAATNGALASASGSWVAFMDQDDELAPDALAAVAEAVLADARVDLVYTDDDKIDREGRRFGPQFKPDWDPDLLLAMCYFSHLVAMRRSVVDEVGGLRSAFDGSQDWDLALRVTEHITAHGRAIHHVPRVLYHWRAIPGSAALSNQAKPWAYESARRALADALARRGEAGDVDHHPRFRGLFHVRRRPTGDPLVSVVIPFRDDAAMLQRCVDSVVADPGHDRLELVLVDNGSTEPEMAALLDRLSGDPRVRVLHDPRPFNWAALNNTAIGHSRGDMVLTLNNDVTATGAGWLREMVVHAQRPEIGAVGARLLYPDGRVQHVGTVVGLGGVVAHPMRGLPGDHPGYMGFATVARGWSAVTGACLLARRHVVDEVGGFDEQLAVAFNDVDFCLRVGRLGYRIVCTPLAELVHAESSTRGFTGYSRDIVPFISRWEQLLRGEDPMFSPNLSRFDARCVVRLADEDAQWTRHLRELGLS
jgi:GT2 family glycosyltransferase